MDHRHPLHRALRIVRLSAWLVPARLREEWLQEWHAELDAASGHPQLVRHAWGSLADAFWIRQRDVADLQAIDDLRHGFRQWRQQAGFVVTAVGILALSMAATVTAFSVVSQILLRELPYPDPDGVVTLWERRPNTAGRSDVAPGNFLDWRARATSFRRLAGVEPYTFDYVGGDRPVVLKSVQVTEGFFDVFGVAPVAGRFFLPDEHQRGNNHVLVLSERFWRRQFHADPSIIGKPIALGDGPFLVAGVAPDHFQPNFLEDVPGETDVYAAKAIEDYEARIRASGYWNVVGRLEEGVTLAHAQAELTAISNTIELENPRTNRDVRAEVITLREHLVGDVRPAVRLFGMAVVAVLLIACVNITNLLLARGTVRQQELLVRSALGASRARLVGQLLVETAMVASVASAAALLLAHGAMRGLAVWGPRDVMWLDALRVDGVAVAFAVALTFLVTIIAGLVPALRLSGLGLQAPGHRTMTADRSQRHLRSALVIAEVALALMLVAGTGLLVRSFFSLIDVDTGFRKDGVMVMQMFAWDRNQGPAALRTFHDRVVARIAELPGVASVGSVRAMPFIESNVDIVSEVRMVDQPAPAPGDGPRSSINVVTPAYLAVMGVRLIDGRLLDSRDGPASPRVVVVTEAFAERYLRGLDPIGQRVEFRNGGPPAQWQIVGVVSAVRHTGLDEPPRAEILVPFDQAPHGSITIVARTHLDPTSLLEAARHAVWTVDPLQTFHRTATLEELVDRTLAARRFALIVLTGFSALAMLLAAAGLYGVLSAIATQYRREIGVRMALGAAWLDILQLVVKRGLIVSTVGVGVGLLGVIGGARLLRGFLFSVTPTDPLAIGGAAMLMLAIAAIACYIPARRAADEDPVQALRVD
jgi:predicted permease